MCVLYVPNSQEILCFDMVVVRCLPFQFRKGGGGKNRKQKDVYYSVESS